MTTEYVVAPIELLNDLVDLDPCSFDHRGGCQSHGYLSLQPGETCPEEAAKQLIAEGTRVPADRLDPWHTIRLDPERYHITHPLDCDLINGCPFEDAAQTWEGPPRPVGVYRWHNAADDPTRWEACGG